MQVKPYGHKEFITFKPRPHIYLRKNDLIPNVTGITGIIDKPGLVIWAANQAGEEIRETVEPGDVLDEISIEELAERASKRHTTIRNKAGGVGSVVHDAIEKYVNARLLDIPIDDDVVQSTAGDFRPVHERAAAAYDAWVMLMLKHFSGVTLTESETLAWNKDAGYIGTMDALGWYIDSTGVQRWIIFDWKTSKNTYSEHGLQLAGYWGALESVNPKLKWSLCERAIVHIHPKIPMSPKVYKEYDIQKDLTGADLLTDYEAFLDCLGAYNWKNNTPLEKRMAYVRRRKK
jgi:hypothetical protein